MAKTFSGYKLEGRTKYHGLDISIENERGSVRRGVDASGREWASFMHIPYGYIRMTEGVDGDHVDCYIGANPHSRCVFIVHQQDPNTKAYDEDKVMLGFNTAADAKAAYIRQYDRPGYFQSMDEVDIDTFKSMVKARYGMKLKKSLEKSKRMPIGTVSHGRKKVAEGKWVPVKPGKTSKNTDPHSPANIVASLNTAQKQTDERNKKYAQRVSRLPMGSQMRFHGHVWTRTDLGGDAIWLRDDNAKGFADAQVLTEFGQLAVDEAIKNKGKLGPRYERKPTKKVDKPTKVERWGPPTAQEKLDATVKRILFDLKKFHDLKSKGLSLDAQRYADHARIIIERLDAKDQQYVVGAVKEKDTRIFKSKPDAVVDSLKRTGLYREGKTKVKVSPTELRAGIEVEMEHTNDREAAKQIALDHLVEDPHYYSKLKKIESGSEDADLEKAKRMPIGTVSHAYKFPIERYLPEGDWVLDDTPVTYDDLSKARTHKYIRRYKKPDGSWGYVYPSKGSGRSGATALSAAVKQAETKVIETTKGAYELAIVLDANGNTIASVFGDKDSVRFTEKERDRVHGAAVFVHNHPIGTSLSAPDFTFAIAQDVGEMRAVAHADGYVYSYKPDVERRIELIGKDEAMNRKLTTGVVRTLEEDLFNELSQKIRDGDMTVEEAENVHNFALADRVVTVLGGTYSIYHPSGKLVHSTANTSTRQTVGKPFVKSKYIRRWRGPDGRWRYEYPNIPEHKTTANLGGSTGAKLISYVDPDTKRPMKGVLKTGASRDHIIDEHVANKVYRILGVEAPKSELHEHNGTLYQITEYYPKSEGWEQLNRLKSADYDRAVERLRDGFVADALLANWDAIGLEEDNILYNTATGAVARIDNGGSLRHRAQGAPKGGAFDGDVAEIDSMRDRGTAGRVFGSMSEADMRGQVSTILQNEEAILDAMPNAEMAETMQQRIASLRARFGSDIEKALSSVKREKRAGRLVPLQVPVTRRGKTFYQRYWVSPAEAEEMTGSRKVDPDTVVEEETGVATSTTAIKQISDVIDYAPDSDKVADVVSAVVSKLYEGRPDPTIADVRATAVQELEAALGKNAEDSGRGWYDALYKKTRAILVQAFPALADDVEWDLFSAILAVTSPNTPVSVNMDSAIKIYAIYKESGRLPTKQPSGKGWPTPNGEASLTTLQNLLDEKGKVGLIQWMSQERSGKDIKSDKAKYYPGEGDYFWGTVNETYKNAEMFGPKVGAFYSNLVGDYSLATIDVWAMRTWRRWTNNIRKVPTSQGGEAIEVKMSAFDHKNINALFNSLAEEMDLTVADVQAVLWYYEKRLYKNLGLDRGQSEDIGYDEAARRVYESMYPTGSRETNKALAGYGKAPELRKAGGGSFKVYQPTVARTKVVAGVLRSSMDVLAKSEDNIWMHYDGRKWRPFTWFVEPFEKAAAKTKKYYSADEIKARGMRWVTIRGARVLLQGTADGGYVVVGGAGGKLNHLRVDSILGKEEYKKKREEKKAAQRADIQRMTKEELAEQREKRKAEVQAKREIKKEYEAAVRNIVGVSESDIKSSITGEMMDQITEEARNIVGKKQRKPPADVKEQDIEKEKEKIIEREAKKQVKNIEREALEVMMNDYLKEDDPNLKKTAKELLDTEKAKEILKARKQFRKALRDIGKSQGEPRKPRLTLVGDVLAQDSKSLDDEVMQEIADNIETAQNIELYDRMNAQSEAVQKYVWEGNASTFNGVIGDLVSGGAVFSPDIVKELGPTAMAECVALYAQETGQADTLLKALESYSHANRKGIVDTAVRNADHRLQTADDLRMLARGDADDAEGLMSMAQANGYALKEVVAAQQELGTAVGSLQGMAHLINALAEPPKGSVYIDMGTDLHRARQRARRAGLQRGEYNIRTQKQGRATRLIMEIPKESIRSMIGENQRTRQAEDKLSRIKRHQENTGYLPAGMNPSIKLKPSQEAGLRFFSETGKALLDYEAGIGKTPTAYAAIMDAMNKKGAKKVLVITPAKLSAQFADESKVFLDDAHQQLVKNVGTAKDAKMRRSFYEGEGIHVASHDVVANDIGALKAAGYDMIVIDEMHEMTPESGSSQRYKALMELKDIPLKMGMSGTNIKNSKKEIHRKIEFIDPNHTLGSMAAFDKKYKGLNMGTSAFQNSSNDAFRKEVAPGVFSQKNDLPVQHRQHHIRVSLNLEQRKKIRKVMETYRGEKEQGNKGAAARRDAALYRIIHDDAMAANSKASEIVRIMKENHPGQKAAVHVQGTEALFACKARLEKEFGEGSVAVVMGQPPYDSKTAVEKAKRDFNDPDSKVKFILGSKSMEAGHNLQGGTVNFHLDQPDTAAAKEQREKRTYRTKQTHDVDTYTLSGTNPLDLRQEDLISRKTKEMGVLGNPQEVEGFDGTGFLAYLNRAEAELRGTYE